jgi:hypothetical protein
MVVRLDRITWWMGSSLPPFDILQLDGSSHLTVARGVTLEKRRPQALGVTVAAPRVPDLFLQTVGGAFTGVAGSPTVGNTKMMLSLSNAYVEIDYTIIQWLDAAPSVPSPGPRADAAPSGSNPMSALSMATASQGQGGQRGVAISVENRAKLLSSLREARYAQTRAVSAASDKRDKTSDKTQLRAAVYAFRDRAARIDAILASGFAASNEELEQLTTRQSFDASDFRRAGPPSKAPWTRADDRYARRHTSASVRVDNRAIHSSAMDASGSSRGTLSGASFQSPDRLELASDVQWVLDESNTVQEVPQGFLTRHHILGRRYMQLLSAIVIEIRDDALLSALYGIAGAKRSDIQPDELHSAVFWSPLNLFFGPHGIDRVDDPGSDTERRKPLSFPVEVWKALMELKATLEDGVGRQTLRSYLAGNEVAISFNKASRKQLTEVLTKLRKLKKSSSGHVMRLSDWRFIPRAQVARLIFSAIPDAQLATWGRAMNGRSRDVTMDEFSEEGVKKYKFLLKAPPS